MREEITENISKILKKTLNKERVVYLMVEIRKLMDKSKTNSIGLNTLYFYCNWVVHTEMSWKFTKDVLSRMEKYQEIPGQKFNWDDFNSAFISLENLRNDLFSFLKRNNLSRNITNIPKWYLFSKYLIEHLRDCPLSKGDGLIREFRFIKKNHIPQAEKYSISYKVSFDGSYRDFDGSVLRFERKKIDKISTKNNKH
jgi:hypothetical protein